VGYKLAFKMQTSDIEMVLGPDMRLQSAALKAPQSERLRLLRAGAAGFLLTSWTMGETGAPSRPPPDLHLSYQTVDGVALPSRLSSSEKVTMRGGDTD